MGRTCGERNASNTVQRALWAMTVSGVRSGVRGSDFGRGGEEKERRDMFLGVFDGLKLGRSLVCLHEL